MSSPVISFVVATVLMAISIPCTGQKSKQKIKHYMAVVSTIAQGPAYRGTPLAVQDSSITIISQGREVHISSRTIKHIRFRNKAAVGEGAAIGGSLGLILGLIYGYSRGDDEEDWFGYPRTAEEKAIGNGLAFSVGGAVVGMVIAAAGKGHKIEIHGDQNLFKSKLVEMKKYMATSH